jgi:hypothetical protein
MTSLRGDQLPGWRGRIVQQLHLCASALGCASILRAHYEHDLINFGSQALRRKAEAIGLRLCIGGLR